MGPKVSTKVSTKVSASKTVDSPPVVVEEKKTKKAKNEPVVEEVEVEVDVEEDSADTSSLDDEQKILNMTEHYGTVLNDLEEMNRMLIQIAQQQIKGVRSLKKDMISQTKKLFKYEQKKASQKKTNQNKGPQKLIPIYSKEMGAFFKDFHMLKDKNDQVIYEKIESDSENILGSREIALKLITAYIKKEGLQDTEDKKRINMDGRLKELLPKLVGAGENGSDNCYYHTLMGAIADHFKSS
jgi:chromatin remodeling complex protein RSC6